MIAQWFSAGIIGVCLVTTGCLATRPDQWTRDASEHVRLKRDIYECKADAAGVSYRATAFGGVILPILGLVAMRSTYNECMEARGWGRDD